MPLDQALAVVKAAGYRVTAPRVRNPVRVARLNAIGKPYSPQHDPRYRMQHKPPNAARLCKPYSDSFRSHLTGGVNV